MDGRDMQRLLFLSLSLFAVPLRTLRTGNKLTDLKINKCFFILVFWYTTALDFFSYYGLLLYF